MTLFESKTIANDETANFEAVLLGETSRRRKTQCFPATSTFADEINHNIFQI